MVTSTSWITIIPVTKSVYSVGIALSIELAANPKQGFSRGAYTARALAGMLHKVILAAKNVVH